MSLFSRALHFGRGIQMRILIVSDTHGRDENILSVLKKMDKFDMMIHCGDVEGSEPMLRQAAGCECVFVRGNNDFFTSLPRETQVQIGKYRVMVTHGHDYGVSMSNAMLKSEAIAKGNDIVIYGHTHRPVIEIGNDITVLNPGSLSYPRQEGRKPSFIVMEIDQKGEAHYTIQYTRTLF